MVAIIATMMLGGAAMSNEDESLTPGGSSILRYDGYQYEFRSPVDTGVHLEKLENFLEGAEVTGRGFESDRSMVRK